MSPRVNAQRFLAAFSAQSSAQFCGCVVALLIGVLMLAPRAAATGPGVKLVPTSLTFGQQVAGTTSPTQKVTLLNTGTSVLTITTLTASSGFKVSNPCQGTVLP